MSNILKPIWWGALLCLLALSLSAFANGDEQPEGDLEEFSTTICCFGLKEFTPSQSVIDDLTKLSARINEIEISNIRSISAVGHTDTSGVEGYDNSSLSVARADSVSLYLQELGVPASVISLSGQGKTEPLLVYNEFGAACGQPMVRCAQNRRVEVNIKYIIATQTPSTEINPVPAEQKIEQQPKIEEVRIENIDIQKPQNYLAYSSTVAAIFLSLMILAFMIFAALIYSYGFKVSGGVFKNGLRWGGAISSALGVLAVIESGTIIPNFNIISPSLYSIIEIYRAAFSPLVNILNIPFSFNFTQDTKDILSLLILTTFALMLRGNIKTLAAGSVSLLILVLVFLLCILFSLFSLFSSYSGEQLNEHIRDAFTICFVVLVSVTLIGPLGGKYGFGAFLEASAGNREGTTPLSDIRTSKATAIVLAEVFVAMLVIGGLGNVLDLIARLF